MRYEVTLRGQRGESETVHVEAESGDAAAAKAFKPYCIVVSVQPAADMPPASEPEAAARASKPRSKKAA